MLNKILGVDMKKFRFLIITTIFLLCLEVKGGEWIAQTLPPGDWALNAVHFVDSTRGVAVGPLNTVFYTNNGGENWKTSILPNLQNIYMLSDVYINSDGFGIIIGSNGLVLKTSNYGQSWEKLSFPATDYLNSLEISKYIWIVSQQGKIYFSTDWGNSWLSHQQSFSFHLSSIKFVNPMVGFISSSNGPLLKTTNGGISWETIEEVSNVNKIFFVDSLIGWVIGDKGYVAKTTDQGLTWEKINFPTTDYLTSLFFVDNFHGWITTFSSKIFFTTDGGQTWTLEYQNSKQYCYLFDIFFVNPQKGWAVGSGDRNNTILTYKSVSSFDEELKLDSSLFSIINNSLVFNFTKSNYRLSEVKVYNLLGNQVFHYNFLDNPYPSNIILDFLPYGVYFVELTFFLDQNLKSKVVKILIN